MANPVDGPTSPWHEWGEFCRGDEPSQRAQLAPAQAAGALAAPVFVVPASGAEDFEFSRRQAIAVEQVEGCVAVDQRAEFGSRAEHRVEVDLAATSELARLCPGHQALAGEGKHPAYDSANAGPQGQTAWPTGAHGTFLYEVANGSGHPGAGAAGWSGRRVAKVGRAQHSLQGTELTGAQAAANTSAAIDAADRAAVIDGEPLVRWRLAKPVTGGDRDQGNRHIGARRHPGRSRRNRSRALGRRRRFRPARL